MIEELGKITSANFGYGGYQDAQIVFRFELGGKGWGCTQTFECGWGHMSEEEVNKDKHIKWTHEDRIKNIGEKAWQVFNIIKAAKVNTLKELEGKPIRAFFEEQCPRLAGRIHHFEILTEVL
jgi:hypothetical protein